MVIQKELMRPKGMPRGDKAAKQNRPRVEATSDTHKASLSVVQRAFYIPRAENDGNQAAHDYIEQLIADNLKPVGKNTRAMKRTVDRLRPDSCLIGNLVLVGSEEMDRMIRARYPIIERRPHQRKEKFSLVARSLRGFLQDATRTHSLLTAERLQVGPGASLRAVTEMCWDADEPRDEDIIALEQELDNEGEAGGITDLTPIEQYTLDRVSKTHAFGLGEYAVGSTLSVDPSGSGVAYAFDVAGDGMPLDNRNGLLIHLGKKPLGLPTATQADRSWRPVMPFARSYGKNPELIDTAPKPATIHFLPPEVICEIETS